MQTLKIMENWAEEIKNLIKGVGLDMERAAIILGISRRTLYNRLEEVEPNADFIQDVQSKLNISMGVDSVNSEKGQAKSQILYFGKLLRSSTKKLNQLLEIEKDSDKINLLKEVLIMKEKMDLLQSQIDDKTEIIKLYREKEKK